MIKTYKIANLMLLKFKSSFNYSSILVRYKGTLKIKTLTTPTLIIRINIHKLLHNLRIQLKNLKILNRVPKFNINKINNNNNNFITNKR